jgi:hypothetical protein
MRDLPVYALKGVKAETFVALYGAAFDGLLETVPFEVFEAAHLSARGQERDRQNLLQAFNAGATVIRVVPLY